MATIRPQKRSSLGLWLWSLLFVMTIVGVGGGLLAWSTGTRVDFWNVTTARNPYVLRIPINVRPIGAYERVKRTDMLDPATNWLSYQELPSSAAVGMSIKGVTTAGLSIDDQVAEVKNEKGQVIFVTAAGDQLPQGQVTELGGALLNVSSIIGRVVKKEKTPGLGFTESTFFPDGTPEGIGGATPPGMRALVLPASTLNGIHTLGSGSKIDLMANIPVGELASYRRGADGQSSGAALLLSSQSKPKSKSRTEPIMIAQEAMILKPVYQRVEASTTSSLTSGKRVVAQPVYEVVLAVHPSDVLPLQSAIGDEVRITCVAHSMRPKEAGGETSPVVEDGPVAPVTAREILAYDSLSFGYFEDPATRRVRTETVSAKKIEQFGIITSLNDLLGAVVKHDIPKGSFITRADLLQAPSRSRPAAASESENTTTSHANGSPFQFASQLSNGDLAASEANDSPQATVVGEIPSVSTFVAPGFRAVAIPWNRLYGAEYLQIDDVVDITASYSLRYDAETAEQERQPDGTVIDRTTNRVASEPTERTYEDTIGFRAESWAGALNARVLGPVGFPPPSAAARFLGESLFKQTGELNGPPVVFAIEERDADALLAALASDKATFSIAVHPTQQDDLRGWKRIVLPHSGLAAYSEFTRKDIEQPHTRRPLTRLVREDDPTFAMALTEEEITPFFGRTLRRAVRRRDFVTADLFVPVNAGFGIAAGLRANEIAYVAYDAEIDGIASLRDNEIVAIGRRAIGDFGPVNVSHGVSLRRVISEIVAPRIRVLRSSQEGRTVLAIPIEDAAILQAAVAMQASESDAISKPSLVVLLPAVRTNESLSDESEVPLTMRSFDSHTSVRTLEAMVGGSRQTHAFPGSAPARDSFLSDDGVTNR